MDSLVNERGIADARAALHSARTGDAYGDLRKMLERQADELAKLRPRFVAGLEGELGRVAITEIAGQLRRAAASV